MKQYTLFGNDTSYHAECSIPYGELKVMIDWCNSNCERHWGYSVIEEAGFSPGNYSFRFESEKDYVKFIMWKQ